MNVTRFLRALTLSAALSLSGAAAAHAEQFTGLHMTADVGQIIGDGAQVGFVPVTITWSLDDPPGVYDSGCYGDWKWGSAPVTIDIRQGLGRDGQIVATLTGTGKTGTVSTTLPAPDPTQAGAYTAMLGGSVTRPANLKDDCAWGEGSEDTRPHDENMTFSLPYPDDDNCVFTVQRVHGKAGVEMPAAETTLPVKLGSTFAPGATLVVGSGSSVELANSAQDGTVLLIRSGKVTFLKGDCHRKQKFSMKLWFGYIWSKVTDLVGKTGNEINWVTDNATMGVRGTIFNINATAGQTPVTKLKVAKGKVQIASRAKPSAKRMVRAGQSSTVKGPRSPSRPR